MVKTKRFAITPFLACFIEVLRIVAFCSTFFVMQGAQGDVITVTALIVAGAIGLIIPITLLRDRANCFGPIISLLAVASPVLAQLFIPYGCKQDVIVCLLFTLSICCNLVLSEIYLSKEGNKNIRIAFICVLIAYSSYGYISVLVDGYENNVYARLSGISGAASSLLIYVITIIVRFIYFRLVNNKKI